MTRRLLILLPMLFCWVVQPIYATSFQGGEEVEITIPQDGDTYIAGGEIEINAIIDGDLTCAGGEITITDTVRADLIITGGEIRVAGFIGDDFRGAGGNVILEADVLGDVIIAGGELTIKEGVTIFGELVVAGGQIDMDGAVNGNMRLLGGELDFNGTVGGNLVVQGGHLDLNGTVRGTSEIAVDHLTLGDNTSLYGDVEYWQSGGELDFSAALEADATATFNPNLKTALNDRNWEIPPGARMMFLVARILFALVVILLMVWAFHRFFTQTGATVTTKPFTKFAYGVVYFVALPMLAGFCFMLIIGIPIGLFLIFLYGFSFIFAHAITATLAAYGLRNYLNKDWQKAQLIFTALGIFIAFKIINLIPFVGILLTSIAVAIAFGAILQRIFTRRSEVVD